MSVIFAILVFSFLIFIHELGHFIAAKSFGVKVNEFSLFMGPALFQKEIGETVYSVRCIPLGGYCAMEGEETGSTNPRCFAAAAWWKRMIILLAGAAMNFIAGVGMLALFFAPDEAFVVPVISAIDPGCTLAGERGIQVGDKIISVDGERVYTYSDFSLILSLNPGDVHDLVLERGGHKVVLSDFKMEKHIFNSGDGDNTLRYGFYFSTVDATFAETMKQTWATALDTVRLVRLSLQMMLRGQVGMKEVSGPVGIVKTMSDVASQSGSTYYAFLNLLYMGGFIAINLAVMNLLPIPGLDGGRAAGVLILALIELILGRKIDPKYEAAVQNAGMTLLMVAIFLILFKDIFMIFRG